jgi:hypothetical protein
MRTAAGLAATVLGAGDVEAALDWVGATVDVCDVFGGAVASELVEATAAVGAVASQHQSHRW